jgi:hypothetical protein
MQKLDNTYLRQVRPGITLWLYPVNGSPRDKYDPANALEKMIYTVIKVNPQKIMLGISIDGQPPFSLVITRTPAQLTAGHWWLAVP